MIGLAGFCLHLITLLLAKTRFAHVRNPQQPSLPLKVQGFSHAQSMQPQRTGRTQQLWEPFRGVLDAFYNLASLRCSSKSHIHIKHAQDMSLPCVSQTPGTDVTSGVAPASSCCSLLPSGHGSTSTSSHQAAVFPWKYKERSSYASACWVSRRQGSGEHQ